MTGPLKARGVGRDADDRSGRTVSVYFDRIPTDPEVRQIHEVLAGRYPGPGKHPETDDVTLSEAEATNLSEYGLADRLYVGWTDYVPLVEHARQLEIRGRADAARLEYLELEANREPILLHDGDTAGQGIPRTPFKGFRGLGLGKLGRSLRGALDQFRGAVSVAEPAANDSAPKNGGRS